MKIARMWALTKIVIRGHILNWPWRSRAHVTHILRVAGDTDET